MTAGGSVAINAAVAAVLGRERSFGGRLRRYKWVRIWVLNQTVNQNPGLKVLHYRICSYGDGWSNRQFFFPNPERQ